MDNFDLGIALDKIYAFIWNEFCDWYIEISKTRLNGENVEQGVVAVSVLKYVLETSLKLLHPFMPFVTEELFLTLQDEEESMMISDWPQAKEERAFSHAAKKVDLLKEAIKELRALRVSLNIPAKSKITVYVTSDSLDVRNNFLENQSFFSRLASVLEVFVEEEKPKLGTKVQSIVLAEAILYVPWEESVDLNLEEERLKEELKHAQNELERAEKMLANERFKEKAPRAKIQEEQEKKEHYQKQILGFKDRLTQIQKKAEKDLHI